MNVEALLSGISIATFAASGIFFLRFWRASRDAFFMLFCLACWFLSCERLALLFLPDAQSSIRTPETAVQSWVYLLRMAAFVMILAAIVQKNRKKVGGGSRQL